MYTYYHLAVHEGQSREDAEEACEDLGMTLAVIPAMFARIRVGDINPLAQHEAFWIGAKKVEMCCALFPIRSRSFYYENVVYEVEVFKLIHIEVQR